jgi:arylsulfatase A-like enzyme
VRGVALLLALLLTSAAGAAERPDLVVVISIDQFRADYLQRFRPWFSKGGFNRFLVGGASFPNAAYRHAVTFTGPGHAAIGTGRNPSESGIVANTWFEANGPFDQQAWDDFFDDTGGYTPPQPVPAAATSTAPEWWRAASGSPRYCVADRRSTVTAGSTTGMSPVTLGEDSLGDRIKGRYPNAKVVAVALKDRAAILMAGRRADAAYWFDNKTGFVSSSYYRYDPSLFDFNKGLLERYAPQSKTWTLSGLIPDAELRRITFDPPEAAKLKNPRYSGAFPHPINDLRALTYSPYGNELLLDFALRVLTAAQLGKDKSPDLFFVGLSTPDYLGHYYGPDSMEVADDAVRLDRSLERFLDELDKRFKGRLLVAVTADHGVQSTPEIARLRDPKADVGRVDLRNGARKAKLLSELPPMRVEIERQLAKALNVPFDVDEPIGDGLVFYFEEPSLYLNWKRIRALQLDGEQVKRALRDVMRGMEGIERVFTNSELLAANDRPDEIEAAMRRSFRADRSGDVLLTLRRGWIWSYSPTNTTHGQPVPEDQHVPVLLWGAIVKPMTCADCPAAPTDIARTIGFALGVEAGSADTRVLPALKDVGPALQPAQH